MATEFLPCTNHATWTLLAKELFKLYMYISFVMQQDIASLLASFVMQLAS